MKNHLPASKRITALLCSLFLFAAVFVSKVSAQVDTEFWFAVPYVNVHHGLNTPNYANPNPADNFIGGGKPIYLKISTLAYPAIVTVSVPAKNFVLKTLNIPANSTQTVDLTPYIDSIVVSHLGNVIEDKGVLIQSTELITAYYENATIQNLDLFSLKGKNALGTEFYTPFQTLWPNDPRHNKNWDDPMERYYNAYMEFLTPTGSFSKTDKVHNREGFMYPSPKGWPAYDTLTYRDSVLKADSAFSAFDIVATENNTSITITPTTDIVGHAKGVPFTIVLNQGQTYSARALHQGVSSTKEGHNTSTWRAKSSIPSDTVLLIIDNKDLDNLSGSHVVSTKKIAISVKDDSVSPNDESVTFSGSQEDFIGDQIVPVDLIGSEYLVMRGKLLPNKTKEYVFIVAVQDNTVIHAGATTYNLSKGKTVAHPLCTGSDENTCSNYVSVYSNNDVPFYVFQVSGYEGEVAGAILPPISTCTGSSQIGFTRTYGGENSPNKVPETLALEKFFMNLLVRSEGGVVDKNAFTIYTGNDDIDWNATNVVRGATFTPIGTSPWSYARIEFGQYQLSNGAHLLRNTKELFHMSFINTTAYNWGSVASLTGSLFGYFSEFNEAIPNATVYSPKTKFDDTVYVDPSQPFCFRAEGGVAYNWTGQKYDSTAKVWNSIDASKILSSTTEYNPCSSGLAQEGAYRFRVDITNSCKPGAYDELYVIVANFIPPYQITDTVCDIDTLDPNVYLSQFYDLNHLNDTIISAKAYSAGYKVTGWYEAVSGGTVTLENYDGTSSFGAGVATNGTIANFSDSDKTGNPSATSVHLIKTGNVGTDIAQKRTVSVSYPLKETINLADGYNFSLLLKYDGSTLALPSNKTNNRVYLELLSTNGNVKSTEMTIADASMTTPQWMEQKFSFAKDSMMSGFTQMRISVVSTFDHTVDYGFYIDDIKREVQNHYQKIADPTKYTFTKHYNTIIAKYEGSGRSVMDTNYVFVEPTGRQTHHVKQAYECRPETDSLCNIDLSKWKYNIGGALVGQKWWYRSISETADTVIYKDSIANIANVCVMGHDTLYAHVQDKCYKYGSLIFNVVPTPVYANTSQTVTLCGDQTLGANKAYANLKTYEAYYYKNNTYKWDVIWYKSASMADATKIADVKSVIVANSDILYGKVYAAGDTLCPTHITLSFVIKDKPAIAFKDTSYCEDIAAQPFNVTPTGGTFTINKVAVTEFKPSNYAGTTVDVVYAITAANCPWLDTAKFTVIKAPVASVVSPATVKYGTKITLDATVTTGSGNYDYTWSHNNMENSIVDPKVEDAQTGQMFDDDIFTLIVVDKTSGCDDTVKTPIIDVQGRPLAIELIPSADPLCATRSQKLTAKISGGVGGYSLQWSTGAVRDSSGVMTDTIIISPTVTTTYTVTVTDHGDRDSMLTATAVVTVYQNPVINAEIVANGATVCQNTPLTLNGTATGGTGVLDYKWSGADVALLTTPTMSNPVFDSKTAPKTYTFRYIVTDEKTCSDTADIKVDVLTLPVLGIPKNQVVCSGHNLTLDAATTGGTTPYTYVWTGDVNYLDFADKGLVVFNRQTAVAATSLLKVKVTDNNTCADSLNITVAVNPLPVPNITGDEKGVCKNEKVTVSAEPLSATYSYVWKSGVSQLGTSQTLDFNLTTVATSVPLNLIVTDNATGCSDSVLSMVTVHELPTVSISAGTNRVCKDAIIPLEAHASSTPAGTLKYSWSPVANISPADASSVKFTSSGVGGTPVSVTVTDERGCTSTAEDVVTVLADNLTAEIVSNLSPMSGNRVPYNMDLKLSASASGGTPAYSYTWVSNSPLTVAEQTATDITRAKFTSLSRMSFTLTVKDVNGCTDDVTKEYYTVDPVTTTYNVDCNKDTIPQNAPQYVVPSCPECDTIKNATKRDECKTQNVYSHDFEICEGFDVLLSPVNSDFGDPSTMQYTWYIDGVKMPWSEKNKVFVPSAVSRNPLAKGDTLTVLVEITNGYMDVPVRDQITIIVNPIPVPVLSVATVAAEDQVLKEFYFTNDVRSDTDDDVLSYKWSGDLAAGLDSLLLVNDSLKYVVPAVINDINPTIALRVEDNHGCIGSSSLGVNQLSLSVETICEDTLATYKIKGLPEGSVLVFYDKPQDWTQVDATTFTAFWTKGGVYPFTVTATNIDPKILIVGDTITQNVISYPEVNIIGLADVCVGQTKSYEVETTESGMAQWSIGSTSDSLNTYVSTDETFNKSIDATWNRVGIDTLMVTVNNGCKGSDYMFVNTHANPLADFKYAPVTDILIGTEVSFTNYSLGEKTDSDLSFYWDFVGEGVFTSEETSPTYKYQDMGTYPVHLIAYDNSWGCVDTAVVNVTVLPNPDCSMDYPNTMITSHSNPKARVFYSFNRVGILEEGYTLKIFNQWGAMVWETNDINAQWDGYYNGSLVAQAVYVFQSEATCENGKLLKQNGDVTVLR